MTVGHRGDPIVQITERGGDHSRTISIGRPLVNMIFIIYIMPDVRVESFVLCVQPAILAMKFGAKRRIHRIVVPRQAASA